MDLLTIGALSQASRLWPKALRLYDSLGLPGPRAGWTETEWEDRRGGGLSPSRGPGGVLLCH